nr:MAG TPA: hypothetical protein [Caudoviricetes sp.]
MTESRRSKYRFEIPLEVYLFLGRDTVFYFP